MQYDAACKKAIYVYIYLYISISTSISVYPLKEPYLNPTKHLACLERLQALFADTRVGGKGASKAREVERPEEQQKWLRDIGSDEEHSKSVFRWALQVPRG